MPSVISAGRPAVVVVRPVVSGPPGPAGPVGPVGPAGGGAGSILFATVAAVQAATIPGGNTFLRIAGFYAAGDTGGGLYAKKTTLDAGAFGVQSADGAWWQLVPEGDWITVRQTGAKGDGSTNDTAAIQAALSAHRATHFPAGSYKVTATLQAQSGAVITGNGRDQSLILRNTVYGATLVVGALGAGNNAGACTIDGLYIMQQTMFNNGTTYVPGTSTSITNLEMSPHISILKGQNVDVRNCRLSGAGGLRFYGVAIGKIDNVIINGVYDSTHSGLQECFANIGLFGLTDSDSSVHFNTEILISNCFLGGIGHTEPRSQTVGNATFMQALNCGSTYGVYCETAEGLVVRNSYIGGNNGHNIYLSVHNIMSGVRIHHNFLDGAVFGAIRIDSTSPNYANEVTIDHNVSQGYGFDDGFLFCPNLSTGTPTCCNLSIKNNIGQGYKRAAVNLNFVKGVQHSGNIWRDYNCKGSTTNDATISAGFYATATYIGDSSNNIYGGATNDPTGANYCQWGSYFTLVSLCTAALERAQNLGMAGGAACNITQTYPT